MSHFSVLVFGDEDDYEDMLGQFDSNRTSECCIGEISDYDREEFLDYCKEDHAEEIEDKSTEELDEQFDDLYEKFGEQWNGNIWRLNDDGDWCEYATENPDAKWDWHEIGGRYDGQIPDNCCDAKKVPIGFVPYAFIDQNEDWHECENNITERGWEKEFLEYLGDYDGRVTLIDCHN